MKHIKEDVQGKIEMWDEAFSTYFLSNYCKACNLYTLTETGLCPKCRKELDEKET